MNISLNSQGFSPLVESGGLLVPGYMSRTKVRGLISPSILRRGGRLEALPSSEAPFLEVIEPSLNGVTNLGFNLMLDSTFRYGIATQYPYFYIGLIGSSGWTGGGLLATDTASSHTSWAEDSTHYTPATYPGAVNNGAGYGSATTSMAIDGVSQAIPNGTPFTVSGITGTYVVTGSTGGTTPTAITFTPGLAGSVADNAAISFGNGRPIWTPGSAANKSITNASSVNFAINTDNTVIKGIFVLSDPTLGGSLGILWSTGLFQADQTLFNGDILKVTYTVSLS